MNIGIVICSRLSSNRLPNKAHLLLENKTIIAHLVGQIKDLGLPIVISVPHVDFLNYVNDESMPKANNILIHQSEHSDDPLARKAQVAKQFGFDAVIRITHDKIFIDTDCLKEALSYFTKEKLDYLYTSNLIAGTNFEIISNKCLQEAAYKFKNVEHISYAVRNVSRSTIAYTFNQHDYNIKNVNLLIDYEDDYKFFQVLFSQIKPNAKLKDVLLYLSKNPEVISINQKPLLSIYTCAYNSSLYMDACIESVLEQNNFTDYEYIMIDDCSSDSTFEIMAKSSIGNNNLNYYRNGRNLGLATSSNIALSKAKGQFILRLDSDDYFTNTNVCSEMLEFMRLHNNEILYPDNYFGSRDIVQKGSENHHVGGAMFNKSALNFIKFTDGLRGYEGYDLFLRANNRLKIGYFEKPTFFYTQRPTSLSKTTLKAREKIKKQIEERIKTNET